MTSRVCTSCDEPHLATDWYQIEGDHPRAGEIECGAAHEDRVRREVRDFMTPQIPSDVEYLQLIDR